MAVSRGKNAGKEQVQLAVLLKNVHEGSYEQMGDTLTALDDMIKNARYRIIFTSKNKEHAESCADEITAWMRQNDILPLLFDKLNEPPHLEKIERILQFLVSWKENSPLTDLDIFWRVQDASTGNVQPQQTYVQSVSDYHMLARLAWDLSRQQLNYVFVRFQQSWLAASLQQQSELMDMIIRVAEDSPRADPMTDNVLNFLWDVYRTKEGPRDMAEKARVTHLHILSIWRKSIHNRDSLKMSWLKKCLEEIERGGCLVSALRLFRGICDQFSQGGRFRGVTRADIVRKLEDDVDVIGVVWSSLKPSWHYIDDVMRHGMIREIDSSPQSPLDASKSKFSYLQQAEESLKFFDYIREIRQTDFEPEASRMKKLGDMNARSDEDQREKEVEEARIRKICQRDLNSKTESDSSNQMKELEIVASLNAVQPETKSEGFTVAYGGTQSPPVVPSNSAGNITNTPGQCQVCENTESLGKNYGGWSCADCKAFFGRSIAKQTVPRCELDGQCYIDFTMRRKCPQCRLKKCFRIGMRMELVAGDDPATKTEDEGQIVKPQEHKSPTSSTPSQVVTSTANVDPVGECNRLEMMKFKGSLDVVEQEMEEADEFTGLQMEAALDALAKKGFTEELDLFRFLIVRERN